MRVTEYPEEIYDAILKIILNITGHKNDLDFNRHLSDHTNGPERKGSLYGLQRNPIKRTLGGNHRLQ